MRTLPKSTDDLDQMLAHFAAELTDRVISDKRAAAMMGISVWTLHRMDARDDAHAPPRIRLSERRFGRRLRDIRDYLRQHEVRALSATPAEADA
jgi:predicted DNA-binding transcriptional regulator AlpA